jgi:tetratricopeptide (TPR) repeat protein
MSHTQLKAQYSSYFKKNKVFTIGLCADSKFKLNRFLYVIDKKLRFTEIFNMETFLENNDISKNDLIVFENSSEENIDIETVNQFLEERQTEYRPAVIFITQVETKSIFQKVSENEIDSILIKPFSMDDLIQALFEALKSFKIRTNFSQNLTTVTKYVDEGKMDLAKSFILINYEVKHNFIVYSKLGEFMLLKGNLDMAYQFFMEALKTKPLHYKSLYGLYMVFTNLGLKKEAYQTVKKILAHFYLNEDDLKNSIRLAIETSHIEDIENICRIYIEQKNQTAEANKYIISGILVLFKYYALKNNFIKASSVLILLSQLNIDTKKHYYQAVKSISVMKNMKIINEVLELFPSKDHDTKEYRLSRLELMVVLGQDRETADYCLKLLGMGLFDLRLLQISLNVFKRTGDKVEFERVANLIEKNYPESVKESHEYTI